MTFEPISLTGEKLEEIDHYGIAYWTIYFDAHNSLLDKIQRVLSNIYFRLGILFSFTLMSGLIVFIILFNKLRKR
ncbi:MAG: hypothetical protein U9Q18_05740 [Caldisericota bacterium]|nr:hypothetical protein [Caldisericota bacterium]